MGPAYTYFTEDGGFWNIGEGGLTEEEMKNVSDKVEAGKYVLYPDWMAAYRAGMKWRGEFNKNG